MTLNILSMIPLSDAGRTRIEGIDPSVRLVMAPNWFHGEFRDTWPTHTSRSYLPANLNGEGTRDERDAMLALSLIHISEPTRQAEISYAVFCSKKKT